MRIFVTGSTGFVGTAVVQELLSHGHTVLGLTRSDAGVEQLTRQGAEPLRGTIQDLDLLRRASSSCDAVIHLAFVHDFTRFEECCATDRRRRLRRLLAAARPRHHLRYHDAPPRPSRPRARHPSSTAATPSPPPAPASEKPSASTLPAAGVRASVVRLPPNHPRRRLLRASPALLVQRALLHRRGRVRRREGRGTGEAPGHVADAARLYRLAVEKAGGAPGSVFHAVVAEGGRRGQGRCRQGWRGAGRCPVRLVPADEAQEHFEWFLFAMMADNPASSKRTREELGWVPSHGTVPDSVKGTVEWAKAKAAVV